MEYCLQTKKSNCKNCYKCIRHCPVKAIKMTQEQAHIIHDECIMCGECYTVCPQNAKQIRNDVKRLADMLDQDKKVFLSVAPSYAAWYDTFNFYDLEDAVKRLGFYDCQQTSIGATIVKKEYENIISERKMDVIISSCCHSVNVLIEKHFPEALPYLANVITPMMAHGKMIKNQYPDSYVAFVGPCISKKEEAEKYEGTVDVVITFEELDELMQEKNVVMNHVGKEYSKHRANLFPTTGGIIDTLDKDEEYSYIAIDGTQKCIEALKNITSGNLHHCFIEMSSCSGSCSEGPLMRKHKKNPLFSNLNVKKNLNMKDYDTSSLNENELFRHFVFDGKNEIMPSSSQIKEVLNKMGKSNPEKELNCGSCGYNTCREKAIAVIMGKADISMCLPYIKEKAESFSDTIIKHDPNGIIVLDENYNVALMNAAEREILNIPSVSEVIGSPVVRILDPSDYISVSQTGKNAYENRKYLAEYDRYVEETVIYDKEYKITIIMQKDVTNEEKMKNRRDNQCREAVDITDKVVEKQMRIVQEIASLLGETTAETKIALTKLKERLTDE